MPTDFNAVPDPRETRLVLAPPPGGSVAPELVQQFIRENHISCWDSRQCIYELSRISADKWAMISTFLSTACRNEINNSKIHTLSHMPLELLTLVIDFATQHNITSSEILFALSNVKMEEFHSFVQLVKAHDLLQKPKIWRALAAMPAQYREIFIRFCKTRQFDINGLKDDMIFQQHTPESWVEIENFLKQVDVSYYVLDKLAKMPAAACLDYLRFISSNEVNDWDAQKELIHDFELIAAYSEISSPQLNYLYDFIQKYQLKSFEISTFSKVPIEHWPSFIALIEENQLTNVKQLSAIASRTPEEWVACAALIVKNNITEFWTLMQLEHITSQHFHFLCAFVNEFHINDEHVIYGLAQIPSIRQWMSIYTLAQSLFAPPLPAEERSSVMYTLYVITKHEYLFDRIMPTYDDNERLARVAVVQERIERGLMPQNPIEYYEQMRAILRTPSFQLVRHQHTILG